MTGAVIACGGGGGAPGVINPSLTGEVEASPALWATINDGSYASNGGSLGVWVTPSNATVAANYQVKVDATSGTFTSGTTGTWLDCSTNRSWTKNSGSVTFTVSFREKATQRVRSVQTGLVLQGL